MNYSKVLYFKAIFSLYIKKFSKTFLDLDDSLILYRVLIFSLMMVCVVFKRIIYSVSVRSRNLQYRSKQLLVHTCREQAAHSGSRTVTLYILYVLHSNSIECNALNCPTKHVVSKTTPGRGRQLYISKSIFKQGKKRHDGQQPTTAHCNISKR